MPALSRLSVVLDGTVRVDAVVRERLPLSAEVALAVDGGGIKARVVSAKIGPVALPLPASLKTVRLSFSPSPELPFELVVPGLTPSRGRLTIP